MAATIQTSQLLTYLKSLDFEGGFFDRLKVYYRPIICPFAELISLARPGEKIGDVGCGSGQFALLLAQFAKPDYVYGIEISERLVNNANQLFKKYSEIPYKFETFDGELFPEALKDLDILYLNDVLHHVPPGSQRKFMSSLAANMKPGARLILKDIDGGSLLRYCNNLHDIIFAGEKGNEIPSAQAKNWLEEDGLQVLSLNKKRMYVYPHYTIVAQKPKV